MQPIFRSNRNHYTRSGDIGAARRRARGRDLLLATDLRRASRNPYPHDAGPDLAVHPPRGRPAVCDPGRCRRHARARRRAPRTPGIIPTLYELRTPPKVRFSATLGEQPEVEVALV